MIEIPNEIKSLINKLDFNSISLEKAKELQDQIEGALAPLDDFIFEQENKLDIDTESNIADEDWGLICKFFLNENPELRYTSSFAWFAKHIIRSIRYINPDLKITRMYWAPSFSIGVAFEEGFHVYFSHPKLNLPFVSAVVYGFEAEYWKGKRFTFIEDMKNYILSKNIVTNKGEK